MALDTLTPESCSGAEALQPTLAPISQPELGKRTSAPSRASAAQATKAPQTGQACRTGLHASSNAHPGPPEHNHGRGTIGPSLPTSDNCIDHPAAGECIPSGPGSWCTIPAPSACNPRVMGNQSPGNVCRPGEKPATCNAPATAVPMGVMTSSHSLPIQGNEGA